MPGVKEKWFGLVYQIPEESQKATPATSPYVVGTSRYLPGFSFAFLRAAGSRVSEAQLHQQRARKYLPVASGRTGEVPFSSVPSPGPIYPKRAESKIK